MLALLQRAFPNSFQTVCCRKRRAGTLPVPTNGVKVRPEIMSRLSNAQDCLSFFLHDNVDALINQDMTLQ